MQHWHSTMKMNVTVIDKKVTDNKNYFQNIVIVQFRGKNGDIKEVAVSKKHLQPARDDGRLDLYVAHD